jgi:hypothetical protein
VIVQALVMKLAVEALDVDVLSGLTRGDQLQIHPLPIGPAIQCPARELRSLVGANRLHKVHAPDLVGTSRPLQYLLIQHDKLPAAALCYAQGRLAGDVSFVLGVTAYSGRTLSLWAHCSLDSNGVLSAGY